jgi:hypothetical protein
VLNNSLTTDLLEEDDDDDLDDLRRLVDRYNLVAETSNLLVYLRNQMMKMKLSLLRDS